MRIRPVHCNGRGFLHGGVISSLADNAMGLSVIEALAAKGSDRSRAGVTLSLAVNYIASGRVGQWFEVIPRVINARQTIAFTDASILADGELVAQATACFRIFVLDGDSNRSLSVT
ncbi:PaaI family thioesterase [Bradyrhizobium sp. USDA 4461]